MATTATVTLASDISAAYSGYSKTMTLTKADTVNDIEETTGFSRRKLASTSAVDIITMADASLLQETADAKAAKVFVQNVGDGKGTIDKSTYVTISIGDTGGTPQEIGRLYGGDWMFIPYSGGSGEDIEYTASDTTETTLEYCVFYE